ncbi:MAG: Nif11-like leader peptide family natural product precursor [Treponema sp.]|nr:Nif11-like leader peptide family natural product precursor [Treponema sp.]
MSQENIKKFFEELSNTEVLQNELTQAAQKVLDQNSAAQASVIADFAKKHGYKFTADELLAAAHQTGDEMLDKDELDAVAGGGQGGLGDLMAFLKRKGWIYKKEYGIRRT